MDTILPDPTTRFGERVAQRLREDEVIWLTTTGADGTPQPNPVWFIWDGESFLIYNRADAARLLHIKRNSRVSLNFNSGEDGNDIVVITGEAREAPEALPPDQHDEYVAKYSDKITSSFQTPENFGKLYPVPIRVFPSKVRGF